jgi:hypothetical protein
MNHVRNYFQQSSIHGFPYISNRKLHVVEKILWIVSLLVSFICCGLLIYEIGKKLEEDAMVVYTSDTSISVTEVSRTFQRELSFNRCSLPRFRLLQ